MTLAICLQLESGCKKLATPFSLLISSLLSKLSSVDLFQTLVCQYAVTLFLTTKLNLCGLVQCTSCQFVLRLWPKATLEFLLYQDPLESGMSVGLTASGARVLFSLLLERVHGQSSFQSR